MDCYIYKQVKVGYAFGWEGEERRGAGRMPVSGLVAHDVL